MTIHEKIKVMLHFAEGGEVEQAFSEVAHDTRAMWNVTDNPQWDWRTFAYRIKEEPKKMVKVAKYLWFNDAAWCESTMYYKNDKEFHKDFIDGNSVEYKRLDHTEIEVEDY